ncbi:cyclin-like protein [Dipodascopsis tothii]|uniref:cyclin-like protein n=1 Tax=Dipodascopsis tothii TaxID=44089 RepID=UPI0034D01D10
MASTRRSTRLAGAGGQDENSLGAVATSRLTRAKAAALESKSINASALQSKQGAAQNNRKRAALGDVSNVHNKDAGVGGDKGGKPAKKMVKMTSTTVAAASRAAGAATAGEAAAALARRKPRTALRTVAGAAVGEAKGSARVVPRATRPARAPLAEKPLEPAAEERESDKENADPESGAVRAAKLRSKLAEQPDADAAGAREAHETGEGQALAEDASDRSSLSSSSSSATTLDAADAVEAAAAEPAVQDWDDLDLDEMDDPTMVAEYVDEIFAYMHHLEWATMPNPRYMEDQSDLQWGMREILVEWLVEVHEKFRLLPETLFLTMNIVDRFLSARVVTLDKLQLVGMTSMFIAAKYEEVFPPGIGHFVYVADSGYTEDEILRAERFILQVLDFNLSYPNPMNFLRRNSKADAYDIETRTMAKYLMEIALVDHRFMKYCPSHVAATAMYLSRIILGRPGWNRNMVHYSGDYTEDRIMPVCNLMIDYLAAPVRHEAFFKKYASKRFLKASILARQWAKRRVELHPLPALDESDPDADN